MNKKVLKKLLICLLSAGIGYLVVYEVQKLGVNLIGVVGSVLLGVAPIAWDWFSKYNARITTLKDAGIQRIELLDGKFDNRLDELLDRLGNLATKQELDQVRSEAYSARAEAQQALNIVNMSLEQSRQAQGRINEVLSSGVLFKLCEMTTKLDLRQTILEKAQKKEDGLR